MNDNSILYAGILAALLMCAGIGVGYAISDDTVVDVAIPDLTIEFPDEPGYEVFSGYPYNGEYSIGESSISNSGSGKNDIYLCFDTDSGNILFAAIKGIRITISEASVSSMTATITGEKLDLYKSKMLPYYNGGLLDFYLNSESHAGFYDIIGSVDLEDGDRCGILIEIDVDGKVYSHTFQKYFVFNA